MVRLELDQVVMRRMREEDIEAVKALIKEGCEGTENRLILHILTRPLCLFILAVFSSVLRCLVHSFILALAIPVFLLIVFLKITMPRSTGVLGSSRPYWDYVGSSNRGTQDETLQNPYARISGKTPVTKPPRRRLGTKEKESGGSAGWWSAAGTAGGAWAGFWSRAWSRKRVRGALTGYTHMSPTPPRWGRSSSGSWATCSSGSRPTRTMAKS
ncbi:unnamed protein product [Tetraodon nigroviridis]|uniref:(spotted green pufferfish) hypothetical protein n=1 Tax=Tetraodon nigroviridis TaxID=99883 RepID=Q4SN44_TETNG|nr:unnamed protein product [Tetraodon nigroviridis]